MKLKNFTIIIVLIFLMIILSFGAGIFYLSNLMETMDQETTASLNIYSDFTKLRTSTFDYLLFHSDRSREQWWNIYDQISQKLLITSFPDEEGKALLERIIIIHNNIGTDFEKLVGNYEQLRQLNLTDLEEVKLTRDLEQLLVAEIIFKTQEVLHLNQDILTNNNQMHHKHEQFVISLQYSFLSLFLVYLILFFILLMNTILKPIQKLHHGTEIIGSGNLNHKVGIKAKNEIGQLSRSFDEMTANLKKREQANQLIFLNTSHELKTPITPINIQLEMLKDEELGKLSPKQKESVSLILRNMERLDGLITDILDISRIQAESIKLAVTTADLKDIVDEKIAEFKPIAKEKNIILTSKVAHTSISCDPLRIKQVFSNLLHNAFKFTQKGSITISAEKKKDVVVVSIKDTGIGISKEHLGKLFHPFYQIKQSYELHEKGTGLGLSIVMGLVKQHGGKVWVESDGKGKGSTFYFTLPLKYKEINVAKEI